MDQSTVEIDQPTAEVDQSTVEMDQPTIQISNQWNQRSIANNNSSREGAGGNETIRRPANTAKQPDQEKTAICNIYDRS